MLTKCPECELQISDKAYMCPHCGFPLKDDLKNRPYKSQKRKRLPNGFGRITKLKNKNLRNPYRVMVTIGTDSNGKPIGKLLKPKAFFPSYNDAYAALVEYNKNPYDLNDDITFAELYDRWSDQHFRTLNSETRIRNIKLTYRYCESIHNMRVKDIRIRHLKSCIENAKTIINGEERTPTPAIKNNIKSTFNLLFDYAVEYEIADKNYARAFNLPKNIITESNKTQNKHIPFSKDEIDILWENINNIEFVDSIIVQCYMGWRPQELISIKLNDVNLKENIIIGGMKTESGKDRIVPIHPKIKPIIINMVNNSIKNGSEYLISFNGKELTYNKYYYSFKDIMKELDLDINHRPHDPRKHFVTMAKKYNVDEYAIKYLIGHSISDITEKIYTDREINWLKKEIKKIK